MCNARELAPFICVDHSGIGAQIFGGCIANKIQRNIGVDGENYAINFETTKSLDMRIMLAALGNSYVCDAHRKSAAGTKKYADTRPAYDLATLVV